MIKLLQTAYPNHYGAKWKDVYSVRFEHTNLASIAIKDRKTTIIQEDENDAVSLYVNPEEKDITIVDWEAYVDQYTNALIQTRLCYDIPVLNSCSLGYLRIYRTHAVSSLTSN
jgi:hypothetical protein